MPKRFIIRAILMPLIARNYRLRAKGAAPDEWYWADRLALKWGMTAEQYETVLHG